jgi:hypothetical protein
VYFYLYSILRDIAVARKHILAGTVAAAGQASRTEELPVSANLAVASLAGMGNVLATNPIWCVLHLPVPLSSSGPGERRCRSSDPYRVVLLAVRRPAPLISGAAKQDGRPRLAVVTLCP